MRIVHTCHTLAALILIAMLGCAPESAEVESEDSFSTTESSLEITSVVDTNPSSSTASTTSGSATTIVVDMDTPTGSGHDAIALLKFDVSSIPAGSTVTKVDLRLNIVNQTSGTVGYFVYKLLRPWSEADATWNAATASTSWSVGGARGTSDRSSTSLGTLLPTSTGLKTFPLNSSANSVVQGWVNTPSSNYGIVIDGTDNGDGMDFSSSESTTTTNRPVLVVTYTPPPSDSFVLGTTKPSASNTGPRDESLLTEVTPTGGVVTLSGGTATSPQIYEKKLVNGRINVTGANVIIRDVIVRMPKSDTEVAGIYVRTAGATNVLIEFTKIEVPLDNRSWANAYGIQGSGFKASRCEISGTIDGISMAGIAQKSYAIAEGNYIHELPFQAYSPGRPEGTHNDGLVMEGNLTTVSVAGNYIRMPRNAALFVNRWNNGVYDNPPEIVSNWFDIEDTATTGAILNVKNFSPVITGLKIQKNRFTTAYPARAKMLLYPEHLTAANMDSSGTLRNVYDDGSTTIVPVFNGSSNVTSY